MLGKKLSQLYLKKIEVISTNLQLLASSILQYYYFRFGIQEIMQVVKSSSVKSSFQKINRSCDQSHPLSTKLCYELDETIKICPKV